MVVSLLCRLKPWGSTVYSQQNYSAFYLSSFAKLDGNLCPWWKKRICLWTRLLHFTVCRLCQSEVVEPVSLREKKNTQSNPPEHLQSPLIRGNDASQSQSFLCVSRRPENAATQETSGADKHNDHNTWVRWIRSQHPRVRKGETGEKGWRREYRGRERGRHFSLGFLFHFLWTSSDNEKFISLLCLSTLCSPPFARLLIYFFPLKPQEVDSYVPMSVREPHIHHWACGRSFFIIKAHLKEL